MPPNYCIGQWDVALTEKGQKQIRCLANEWSAATPERIVCSDLCRTRETAEVISRRLNIPCHTDQRLREINFGEWENRSWDEIYEQDPLLMTRWGENWLETCPPGGESVRQLYERVGESLSQLGNNTLVVAHAGSLRALQCHLLDASPQRLFDYTFEHGTPITVD